MRIAFLTDLHLGAAGDLIQNVDVRQNFLKALEYVDQLKPNCLVLGGDICDTAGNRETYEWVKKEIDKLPFPRPGGSQLCFFRRYGWRLRGEDTQN